MSPSLSIRLLLTQSDSRLLELAQEGNVRAYEALVQRYRRQLLHYCRRALLPDERAEDALQQAFLQAWLALEHGVHVTNAKAWLYRIVHNAALNTLRVSGYDYCKLNETLSGEDAPQDDLDRRIAVREALAGLAALPEMQREALLRTAVEGRSHEHVARDLGVSENALRGLVYRARATLRSAATALTPMPLLSWISNPASRGAPLVERLAEIGASGGSESAAALVLKGTTVALTLGALATGIGSHVPHHPLPGTHQHTNSLPRTPAATAPALPLSRTRSIDLDSFARAVKSGGSTSRKAGTHRRSHDGARSRSTVVGAFPPAQSPPLQPRDRPTADRRGGDSEDPDQPGATSGQGGPSDQRDDGDGRDKAGGPGRTAGPGGGERNGGSSGGDSVKGDSSTGSGPGSDSDSGSNSGSTGGSTSGSGSSGQDSSGKGPSGGDSSSDDPSSGDSSSNSPSSDGSSGGKSSDLSSPETGSPADSSQNDSTGGGSSEGSASDQLAYP